MRLTRIQYNGYKRLRNTGCNVDSKIIAFVGPNEAGKSSVLDGLEWLTADDEEPLPSHARARGGSMTNSTEVVRATFLLEPGDLAAIADVRADVRPRLFHLVRTGGGQVRTGTTPSVVRPRTVFERAVTQLAPLADAAPRESAFDEYRLHLAEALKYLNSDPWDGTLSEEQAEHLTALAELLDAPPQPDGDTGVTVPRLRRNARLARLVREVVEEGRSEHPYTVIRQRLRDRSPSFVLFQSEDRVLQSAYDLADAALRQDPPRALVNLLTVAGTSVSSLWNAIRAHDVTRLRTLLGRANEALK